MAGNGQTGSLAVMKSARQGLEKTQFLFGHLRHEFYPAALSKGKDILLNTGVEPLSLFQTVQDLLVHLIG